MRKFLPAILSLARPSSATPNATFDFPLTLSRSLSNMPRLAPVISISHGGGPMPLLGDPSHRDITNSLQTKVPQILRLGTPDAPRAIIVVTAHWSTEKVTISSGKRHELYYDYAGFPPESYQIRHDAPSQL